MQQTTHFQLVPLARARSFLIISLLMVFAAAAMAEVPHPSCAASNCSDPSDFGSYLFLQPGQQPNDFNPLAEASWKYNAGTGVNIVGAWQLSTGRPDVVVAILDSGIRRGDPEVARGIALNAAELPLPAGCAAKDCNGDGFISVDDYAGVTDHNRNGRLDGQNLIREFSDGVDDDNNGYIDDIAGWDFYQNDNDPEDDVDFGHGTGQAKDVLAEANNGSGSPGFAPSSLFLPLRVGDSFVVVGSDFAQAVVYAVDRQVSVVSEALGALSASPTSQAVIDYAYRRGIPVIASAADEESRHHNLPAALNHTIWVNSIVHGDGVIVEQEDTFDLLNGCTNYGGRAWVAMSSNSCSSEATGRTSGLVALLIARGENLIDRGLLSPYPGLDTPFSAEEIRQLLRQATDDIDHEGNLGDISMLGLLKEFLSARFPRRLIFDSERFPTQAGWDQYTGYGRPDARRLLEIREEAIPPEADLSGGLRWFDTIDPRQSASVPIVGSAAAVRTGGGFDYVVDVGCGVQPKDFREIETGASTSRIEAQTLARWDAAQTARNCGFDPSQTIQEPDAHTVTLRLRVIDARGNLGIDRRTVAIHSDPTLRLAPIRLGSSGEGSPALVDMDRDGDLEIAYATSDGSVHVFRGDTGDELPGFPTRTDAIAIHPSQAYDSGEVPVPHEAVIAPTAADDLDNDGRVEIVVASMEGKLYVFDDSGQIRPGFPVATDPNLSNPRNRDRINDTDPGILAAPTLADLDGPGGDPGLEIIAASFDGHVYAWRHDGTPQPGFPVRIADPAKVVVDAATGRVTPLAGVDARARAAKLVGSPAVGDLDGDGFPEIVVASSEIYGGEPRGIPSDSRIVRLLETVADLGVEFGLEFDIRSRVYALHHDGALHPGGPFLSGWPAPVRLVLPDLLPTVASGTPGAPALADLDGNGKLAVAIFGAIGPIHLYDSNGRSLLGEDGGKPRTLAQDFRSGFPFFPRAAGSKDAPFFGALGSGAFGDLTGDGLPEYIAPTAGLRKTIDIAAPGNQQFSDHQISAWNPRTGRLGRAFPRVMDDTQFLSSPAVFDVDGDGRADIVQGSGGYFLRAFRADGRTPTGWPKFTHGWILASPIGGDVDGDGQIEVVAATREGQLYVWDTPAPATESAIQWQGFGRDRRNTQNLSSGVPSTVARQ